MVLKLSSLPVRIPCAYRVAATPLHAEPTQGPYPAPPTRRRAAVTRTWRTPPTRTPSRPCTRAPPAATTRSRSAGSAGVCSSVSRTAAPALPGAATRGSGAGRAGGARRGRGRIRPRRDAAQSRNHPWQPRSHMSAPSDKRAATYRSAPSDKRAAAYRSAVRQGRSRSRARPACQICPCSGAAPRA